MFSWFARPLFWISLILLAAGGYVLQGFLWSGEQGSHLPPSALVEYGSLQEVVTATGVLVPIYHVDVGAQISGQLLRLHVEVGDHVEAGQLLAEIDARVQEAHVAASRAQLRAQAAQLRDRQAQKRLAEYRWQRQQALYTEQAITEDALQQAQAQWIAAQAQVEQLQAQIEQNRSSLTAAEANLEYARILAPMSGTVVSINARQGQTLNANQQAPVILQLADLSHMRVQTRVSEADIGRLRPGLPAYFTTLGHQNQRWQGELLRIEPTPLMESNVVLYNAPFDVENLGARLLPRMTAQVFYVVAEVERALLLPSAALERLGRERYQVEVLLPDGQRETRVVTLGVNNRIQAQVISGLAEGERVILRTAASSSRPAGMPR